MDIVKRQGKTTPFVVFIMAILMLMSVFCVRTTPVKAEETTNAHSVQEIVDNSIFVTFRKGETESRGKYIIACFYVPKEYYNESYVYGAVIFPKDYGIENGLLGDYLKNSEEKGVRVLNIVVEVAIPEEEGYGMNCGVVDLIEENLSIPFSFIFYVKDLNGNIAYMQPKFATYNSLNASEMTMEELIEKSQFAKDMQSSFRRIVTKIEELVDSFWNYIIIAFSSIVLVWGAYIGIRIAIAKKNEEKINASEMVKNLIIGIVIIFIIAVSAPLLISGLSHWILW